MKQKSAPRAPLPRAHIPQYLRSRTGSLVPCPQNWSRQCLHKIVITGTGGIVCVCTNLIPSYFCSVARSLKKAQVTPMLCVYVWVSAAHKIAKSVKQNQAPKNAKVHENPAARKCILLYTFKTSQMSSGHSSQNVTGVWDGEKIKSGTRKRHSHHRAATRCTWRVWSSTPHILKSSSAGTRSQLGAAPEGADERLSKAENKVGSLAEEWSFPSRSIR